MIMKNKTYLVLTQYRNDSKYNDFIGKYYHFPVDEAKSYLGQRMAKGNFSVLGG